MTAFFKFTGAPFLVNRFDYIASDIDETYDFAGTSLSPEICRRISEDCFTGSYDRINSENSVSLLSQNFYSSFDHLAFTLDTERPDKVVIFATSTTRCKIFVDGVLRAGCSEPPLAWCAARLGAGMHTVVIVIPERTNKDRLSVRISSYKDETENQDTGLFFACGELSQRQYTLLYSSNRFRGDGFSFTAICSDVAEIPDRVKILIRQSPLIQDAAQILFTSDAEMNREYVIPADKRLEPAFQIQLVSEVGNVLAFLDVFCGDLTGIAHNIIKEAEKTIESDQISDYDKNVLRYYIWETGYIINPSVISNYASLVELNQSILRLKAGESNRDLLYKPGNWKYFYISKLDNAINYFFVSVPENFRKDKEYPLLLNFSIGNHSFDSAFFSRSLDGFIIADVSGRGVTEGSYIGECSLLNEINELTSTYRIDKKRVYAVGNSAGATAVINFAKSYPDFFAGAVLYSGNFGNTDIMNLRNMKIINVSSDSDHFIGNAVKPVGITNHRLPFYRCILTDSMNHDILYFMRTKANLIKETVSFVPPENTGEISFSTQSNFHTKNRGVRIGSVSAGKKRATISVKYLKEEIRVSCRYVDSFEINVPEQLSGKDFDVIINNKTKIGFSHSGRSKLSFERKNNFSECEKITGGNYYKGFGLLSVFLKPVTVFAADAELSKTVAGRFSSPKTMGLDNSIYVNYPIISSGCDFTDQTNYIIIDFNEEACIPEAIKEARVVQTDIKGYSYNNRLYEGGYVAFQIFRNPFREENCILYVSSNSADLVNKCFFLRNIIIPSYSSGFHNFLNHEILIYDGENYRAVFENGMEIRNVSRTGKDIFV